MASARKKVADDVELGIRCRDAMASTRVRCRLSTHMGLSAGVMDSQNVYSEWCAECVRYYKAGDLV